MIYCYHCTARLTKNHSVCPHCNKTLDLSVLKSIYDTGHTSGLRKTAILKMKLREHSRILIPLFTLMLGVGVGVAIWWGYAKLDIARVKTQFETQTLDLQTRLTELQSQQSQFSAGYETRLAEKDSVIAILASQKETLTKLIDFTRRMVSSASIVPNSEDEVDFYRRNSLYLISLFNEQEQSLTAAGHASDGRYNLQTIPELLVSQTVDLAPVQQ